MNSCFDRLETQTSQQQTRQECRNGRNKFREMSSEALSVALAEVMENADWKVKLEGILEEKDIRVQEALDQREEVFRLETEKIRGMESNLETQVSRDL